MVVGDYTFVLKVTDTGGQTASSSVTVVVQPDKNAPPVAVAGSDKVRTGVLWSLRICLICNRHERGSWRFTALSKYPMKRLLTSTRSVSRST